MKRIVQIIEFFGGMLLFGGGIITYFMGLHEYVPVPRQDLVVIGTSLVGLVLLLLGSELFTKSKENQEANEQKERKIFDSNASMASGFKVITSLLVIVVMSLVFTGYMNEVSFFCVMGTWMIGEITYFVKLYYYKHF